MSVKYALLDKNGGWLVNIIMWDGNVEKWQPPAWLIAKPASEVDFSNLPERPEE